MRVMFAIWPAPAHLYPLVPLAWALRAAGHEVVVASHPGIAESVAAMGLTPATVCTADSMPVPMGPGRAFTEERAKVAAITDALDIAPADREHWNVFSQFYLPAMWDFNPYAGSPADPLPAMDGLVELVRGWRPDLMLWDPCFAGAAVAARACGVPHARWWTAPDVIGWSLEKFIERSSRPGAPTVDNPLVETVRPMAERYGVEVDTETLLGQWTLNPMPRAMDVPVDTLTIPVRWIPHSTQGNVPDWVYQKPDRPRVALSLGLSSRQFLTGGWDHVPMLLEAMSELDIEVIATLNEDQLAGVRRVPDNVRVVDFVPLNQLVPTCAVLVHHGGLGTAAPAFIGGVPQLVTDFADAEIAAVTGPHGGMGTARFTLGPATSRYVTGRGAGLVMNVSRPNVDEMRKQLVRVLGEPEFLLGANRIREELLATPSPIEIVPILERLTEQHRH